MRAAAVVAVTLIDFVEGLRLLLPHKFENFFADILHQDLSVEVVCAVDHAIVPEPVQKLLRSLLHFTLECQEQVLVQVVNLVVGTDCDFKLVVVWSTLSQKKEKPLLKIIGNPVDQYPEFLLELVHLDQDHPPDFFLCSFAFLAIVILYPP